LSTKRTIPSYTVVLIMPEPKEVAQSLLDSLPALEESVRALKAKSWDETTEALETLDRAKMNVLLSYAINDLIWGELTGQHEVH